MQYWGMALSEHGDLSFLLFSSKQSLVENIQGKFQRKNHWQLLFLRHHLKSDYLDNKAHMGDYLSYHIYHVIENTVNQNQESHSILDGITSNLPIMRPARSHWLGWPLYFLCRAWYKIVIPRFLVLCHWISHLSLVFSWYTKTYKWPVIYSMV